MSPVPNELVQGLPMRNIHNLREKSSLTATSPGPGPGPKEVVSPLFILMAPVMALHCIVSVAQEGCLSLTKSYIVLRASMNCIHL